MTQSELKQTIKRQALVLGFSKIGFTNAEYDPINHSRFLQWLAKEYHGNMAYLARGSRKRFDPRLHLDNAKSVIVCAINYYNEPRHDPDRPYISIYARGENYHDVVREKLRQLSYKIIETVGHGNFKCCVDSSAIAEKAFAVKAGLGFWGNNGNLIINQPVRGRAFDRRDPDDPTNFKGSFCFLGIIITDLEIEPDEPIDGTCGKCRKCIEACPTDAIIGDKTIDARLCISYQTIENKDEIPDEIASKMQNMFYGCDICQLICPYNSRPVIINKMWFSSKIFSENENANYYHDLNKADFENGFRDSVIGEITFDQFRRNAGIVRRNIEKS